MVMSRHADGYVRGAATSLPALNLSAGYNVATALLTGGLTVADLAPPGLAEEGRWQLAERVRLYADEELSRRGVMSTAPVGETLRHAGRRALEWETELPGIPMEALLEELGPPAASFENATKMLGCRMTVRMRDGREETCELLVSVLLLCGPAADLAEDERRGIVDALRSCAERVHRRLREEREVVLPAVRASVPVDDLLDPAAEMREAEQALRARRRERLLHDLESTWAH